MENNIEKKYGPDGPAPQNQQNNNSGPQSGDGDQNAANEANSDREQETSGDAYSGGFNSSINPNREGNTDLNQSVHPDQDVGNPNSVELDDEDDFVEESDDLEADANESEEGDNRTVGL